ncbi:hypothetical protein NHF50_06540 [Flavobacterium sp. NRK F10]|uniref:Lipoprotein n=1 Tax=Flavobacterium sediminis TaxID=2201181 RepID=A0A2U8QUV5_9FLAO|nr:MULTISPECIES: hypothetical protein [Flavobacterium]AWM13575.1 hypothetical protein DI487_06675 [Flavobacterium sediminis]MCO6174699.1 hypothetical protein [Flavobacterium sp. NRK F10]
MKTLATFILGLMTLTGCNCQKAVTEKENITSQEIMKQQTIPVLEYEAFTRGFYQKITVTDQKVSVVTTRNGKAVVTPISDKDWEELQSLYATVDKEGLATLESPTQKRFYDGAPIANLRVIDGDKIYESAAFDGGFPPQAIEKIVNKLIEVADNIKEQ